MDKEIVLEAEDEQLARLERLRCHLMTLAWNGKLEPLCIITSGNDIFIEHEGKRYKVEEVKSL